MATITQEVGAGSFTPINIWAMLRALINNNCPILTVNGILFPVTNGPFPIGTYANQAGKGSLLIDYANAILYMNTGTLASPIWTLAPGSGGGGNIVGEETFVPIALTTNGAISPSTSATYVITKVGALLDTLAAPIPGSIASGGNDGVDITISSSTPYNHIISAIGLLETGTSAVNYITFPGYAGGEVDLMAYNGKWIVMNAQAVSFQ